MNLVDSSGWLEYFASPATAEVFKAPLADRGSLIVPTICIFEVHRVISRQYGNDIANRYAHVMRQGRVVNLETADAIFASEISVRNRLATADAIIYATAVLYSATLWTQDAHFKDLPNVRYSAKPPAS